VLRGGGRLFLGPRAELVAGRFRSSRLRGMEGARGEAKRANHQEVLRGKSSAGIGARREGRGARRFTISSGHFFTIPCGSAGPFHPRWRKGSRAGLGIRAPGDKNAKQKADYVTEG